MKIGIDVVEVARLAGALERCPALVPRLFSAEERALCGSPPRATVHLAGRLAAKEAIMKALGLTPLLTWAPRITIGRAGNGAPRAHVAGLAHPPEIALSITHDGPVAVAVALCHAASGASLDHLDALGPWLDKVDLQVRGEPGGAAGALERAS